MEIDKVEIPRRTKGKITEGVIFMGEICCRLEWASRTEHYRTCEVAEKWARFHDLDLLEGEWREVVVERGRSWVRNYGQHNAHVTLEHVVTFPTGVRQSAFFIGAMMDEIRLRWSVIDPVIDPVNVSRSIVAVARAMDILAETL